MYYHAYIGECVYARVFLTILFFFFSLDCILMLTETFTIFTMQCFKENIYLTIKTTRRNWVDEDDFYDAIRKSNMSFISLCNEKTYKKKRNRKHCNKKEYIDDVEV